MKTEIQRRELLTSEDALHLEFQAHLAEYENLYKAMLNAIDGARQVLANSLLISAAAIPILSTLIQQRLFTR